MNLRNVREVRSAAGEEPERLQAKHVYDHEICGICAMPPTPADEKDALCENGALSALPRRA